MIINRPIIYLIHGQANQGKTTLAGALSGLNEGTWKRVGAETALILMDQFIEAEYMHKVNEHCGNISHLCGEADFDINDRIVDIVKEIHMDPNIREIIIEGTYLAYHIEKLIELLKVYGVIVDTYVEGFKCRIWGRCMVSY
jgi:uridine kinase